MSMQEKLSHSARTRAKRLVTVVLALLGIILALHLVLPDGLDGTFALALCSSNDTVYAEGFTEIRYIRVRGGMKEAEVRHLLGEPLLETWTYNIRDKDGLESNLVFKGGRLSEINLYNVADARPHEIVIGMNRLEVMARLGLPHRKIWFYTDSRARICYRERKVIIDGDRVAEKDAEVFFD